MTLSTEQERGMRRFWTDAEYAALDSRYPHERTDVIAKDLGSALRSVYAMASLRGLHKTAAYRASPDAHRFDGVKGVGSRFVKGLVPWNNGMRWDSGGRSHATRFKPGTVPPNRQEVGALRISSDGVLDIKARDGLRGWEPLSRWTWKRERGPIPKGMAVRFEDLQRGGLIGSLDLLDCVSESTSPWFVGRYGFVLARPEPMPFVRMRGALGFFRLGMP